jgi:lipopolysaccharide/colanic/teichoic acid biosynthesis glycosyltransferase
VALGQQPMLMVIERPMKDWRALAKNGFDRLCAAIILAMIAPLLGLVAILIRIDTPGPILFRQLRVGYNNQLFPIFKFRTMHAHATDRLATTQTTRGDVRVTRVGRVLRKLSIDELPQLFNVLLGNMSLVGPRPHAPGTSAAGQRVDLLIENYARRHLVKPGITGLAQVRGFRGGMTTFEQVSRRVQCDLEYITHQSIWLDIKIMVMTLLREVGGGRAF